MPCNKSCTHPHPYNPVLVPVALPLNKTQTLPIQQNVLKDDIESTIPRVPRSKGKFFPDVNLNEIST